MKEANYGQREVHLGHLLSRIWASEEWGKTEAHFYSATRTLSTKIRYNLLHETIGHHGSSSARRACAAVACRAHDEARVRSVAWRYIRHYFCCPAVSKVILKTAGIKATQF